MQVPLTDLPAEHALYADELHEAIERVYQSGQYIGGGEVEAFERSLAAYLSLPAWSVVTCANGSDALLLALKALDLPQGGEVLIATHNYVSAAEAALHLGLVPVWVDLAAHVGATDPADYQMDSSADYLESLCTEQTVAVVAVNMYGHPCHAEAINQFCDKHRIPWIEDNAQGMGGRSKAIADGGLVALGTRATLGTTSFFPTKPLGCMGDGGAVFVPSDAALAERVRQLARHGQQGRYHYVQCGLNSRLDSLQAAILGVKLRHLDEMNRRRSQIADRYDEQFADLPIARPLRQSRDEREALYLYTIAVPGDQRDRLLTHLHEAEIDARPYYPDMLHRIAVFNRHPLRHDYPHADALGRQIVSLPVAPTMTAEQVEWVCRAVRQFWT